MLNLNPEIVYFIIFLISFLVTFAFIPLLIPKLREKNFVGLDMNKRDKPEIPEIGGIAVVIGFLAGFFLWFILNILFIQEYEISEFLIMSTLTIILISFVGLIDDLLDIRQIVKAILPFFFAIPLGIYVSEIMYFPIFGEINFGPLMFFLVPLGVTCAANSTNMLEGFNGLGTGLGLIITSALIIISFINEEKEGLYFLVPLLGSLLAFFYYNKYPAKIFPGDTLTLFIGGTIGCSAIVANLKLEGVILMMPMIVEFFLKYRGRFAGESFAMENQEGILVYEGKIESLTHFVMANFTVTEKGLVSYFFIFEFFLAILVVSFSYLNFI